MYIRNIYIYTSTMGTTSIELRQEPRRKWDDNSGSLMRKPYNFLVNFLRQWNLQRTRDQANVVDFDFATSCHFMPLHATSCHFEWRMPLQVACHFEWRVTSSGICHFEWRMPLRVACWLCSLRIPSGVWRVAPWACNFMPLQVAHATSCHFKWRVAPWACQFMPLQVAQATSSGISHREHATSCHFKWRMPLQVACRTVSMPLHANANGTCHFEWVSHREHATSYHFKWRMPLQVACRTVSMPLHANANGTCHFEWVSHREHATSYHFKWRMPLQVACRTVSMPLHATSCHFMPRHATWSGVKWRNRFTHLLRAQWKSTPIPSHCTVNQQKNSIR